MDFGAEVDALAPYDTIKVVNRGSESRCNDYVDR